jgi:hypothetical protein
MLTSWNDLFALLENKQEAQADSEIALYVIPKHEFALKKKFRNSFLQNVLYTVCNSDISFEHAKDALDTMEYILIAMKKDISQLYGIAFVQIRSYDVFIQDNASICYNVFGVELEPQPSICSVCYVSLICSFPKSKCGQKILSYLERRGYADFKCDAIALHSIPERYSYYVSLGFYRTNNLASIILYSNPTMFLSLITVVVFHKYETDLVLSHQNMYSSVENTTICFKVTSTCL